MILKLYFSDILIWIVFKAHFSFKKKIITKGIKWLWFTVETETEIVYLYAVYSQTIKSFVSMLHFLSYIVLQWTIFVQHKMEHNSFVHFTFKANNSYPPITYYSYYSLCTCVWVLWGRNIIIGITVRGVYCFVIFHILVLKYSCQYTL